MIGKLTDTNGAVVYIEYIDGAPHSVVATKDGNIMHCFDFDPYAGNKTDLMFRESGSGGSIKEIYPPHFVRPQSYWISKEAAFQPGTSPNNCKRLKYPRKLKYWLTNKISVNPFKVAERVQIIEYCAICEQYFDEEGCEAHQILSHDCDELIYKFISIDAALKAIRKYREQE